MLSFPIGLEQTGSKQQRQVLGAHLVQVGTFLDPERRIKRQPSLHRLKLNPTEVEGLG